MAISYKKLWKLLIDKEMTAVALREKTGIAPNTMTKLRRDEEVSMAVLIKICTALGANIGDTSVLLAVVKPILWPFLPGSWPYVVPISQRLALLRSS